MTDQRCRGCDCRILECRCVLGQRRDRIARIVLAIQRGGGDHLGDVDSIHMDLIMLLKELKDAGVLL